MLGLSLPGWENLMVSFLVVAGFFALLAGVSTWIVVKLQRTEIASSKDELERYKVDAGEKISAAEAAGAKANEEAAKANKATEEIRRENLELEKAVAPRMLEQGQPARALKPFGPIDVKIIAVPDFETRRFSSYLVFMLKGLAGWSVEFLPDDGHTRDGIEIQFIVRVGPDWTATEEQRKQEEKRKQVAATLCNELRKQEIETTVRQVPEMRSMPGLLWPAQVPHDSLIVRVGMRPMSYFLDRRFPQSKEIREHMEKMQADMQRKQRELDDELRKRLEGLPGAPLPAPNPPRC
jgi:hypothetical protein